MARGTTASISTPGSTEELVVSVRQIDEGDDEDFNAPLSNFSIEESGDVYLARLILAQAAMDAQSPHDDYVRICARAYLTNINEDLNFICDMGRVNVGFLVRTWRRLLGGVTPFPENYEALYKREKKWKKAKEDDNEDDLSSGVHQH